MGFELRGSTRSPSPIVLCAGTSRPGFPPSCLSHALSSTSINMSAIASPRPIPDGWVAQFSQEYQTFFYVNTRARPPMSSWVHPSGLFPGFCWYR
jgi:hypothetical protein